MNILLTGMRGSGKTFIGKALADIWCIEYVDIDEEIEKTEKASIEEIVELNGWDYFREKEHEQLEKHCEKDFQIISVGGGAIAQKQNEQFFCGNGSMVCFINTPIDELERRLETEKKRPRLTRKETLHEEIETVWNERKDLYLEYADIVYEDTKRYEEKQWAQYAKAIDMMFLIHKFFYADIAYYAIIGDLVGKSKSPFIHNTGFQKKNIRAMYYKCRLPDANLLSYLKDKPLAGGSITIPFKEDIIPLLDFAGSDVKKIGACNTLKVKNGKWAGYNTDHYGFVKALEQVTDIKDKHILLIGAGGAARAIVYGLSEHDATITIANRTYKTAVELADEFGCKATPLEEIHTIEYDILVNATPSTMPIPAAAVRKGTIVYDINYQNPSKFLEEAKKKNCITLDGLPMLLYQAEKAWDYWMDEAMPTEEIHEALNL